MSRWLALAVDVETETQTPPDSLTKPDKTPSTQPERGFCQVLSNCQVDPQEKTNVVETPDFRHGKTVCGWPKTWTGKIVSLDDWRKLTEWERHGPNGRHWDGITRKWEVPS